VRRLLIALAVVTGATLTGLLLASVLLKQECPDCSGTAKHLQENPSQCIEGPAVLDCPRCGDVGRISLFNGKVGPSPDPLIAALMRHSNRESWRSGEAQKLLRERLQQSPLKMATGDPWTFPVGVFGRARFVRAGGTKAALLMLQEVEGPIPGLSPVCVFLFDDRGTLLDGLKLKVRGGVSAPQAKFAIPVGGDGSCVQLSLLNWKNQPCASVEIDHRGKSLMDFPEVPGGKLDQLKWTVFLRDRKLRIVDGQGKTISE
jgi:hypothetical protein